MLTLQFVPYIELTNLASDKKIQKLLNIVRTNKIVLMQGRLRPNEETELIQKTMEVVDKDFKGIELCTIYPESKEKKLWGQVRNSLIKFLVGGRDGFTIIGPASVVKEIRRNPGKIELLTQNINGRR